MICKNCGTENAAEAKFCENCGTNIEMKVVSDAEKSSRKKKGKKAPKIVFAILVLVILAGSVAFFANRQAKASEYKKHISEADKYIEELDYENAKMAYLEAIKVNPREEDPYIKLANVYIKQEQYDEAIDILEKCESQTSSGGTKDKIEEVIVAKKEVEDKEKLEKETIGKYEQYVNETLIPQYGIAGGSEWTYGGVNIYEDPNLTAFLEETTGIYSVLVNDINKDGNEELLVAMVENRMVKNRGGWQKALSVHIYSNQNNEIVELAVPGKKIEAGVYAASGTGSTHIFIKEGKEANYVCMYNFVKGAQLSTPYIFMDIFEVVGNEIICKKSVTVKETQLLDTTMVIRDLENKGSFSGDGEKITEAQMGSYIDLVGDFVKEVEPSFELGDWFETDWQGQVITSQFDYDFSEKMDKVTELLKISGEESVSAKTQSYRYTDYTKFKDTYQPTADANPVKATPWGEKVPISDEVNGLEWSNYYNSKYDYSVQYPKEYISLGESGSRDGSTLQNQDGTAKLIVWGGYNILLESGESALQKALQSPPMGNVLESSSDAASYVYTVGDDTTCEHQFAFYAEGKNMGYSLTYPTIQAEYYRQITQIMDEKTLQDAMN